MIDHVSIGVSNIARAKRFYDAALKPLGYSCLDEGRTSLGYGRDKVELWILAAKRPVTADAESGLHFCFSASTHAAVDAFHVAALAGGGSDNGKPGQRPDYGQKYYAAYVADPDGYRLEAHCGR